MRRSVRNVRPRGRGTVSKAAGILGELLLTAGFLILLYVAYVLWGTGIQTERAQDEMRERIETLWEPVQESTEASPDEVPAETDTPAEADAPSEADAPAEVDEVFGIIRIPRLGNDWEWVVVDEVDLESLSRGPGHYPQSAMPGELGNLAIAGHRSGHGAPFHNLDRIQAGDTIEIERADGVWTYTVDRTPTVIDPSDVWVVAPVPGAAAEAEPTERRITLTTCHPRYGSSQRMFVSGVLTSGEEI
ncbi:MAG TPA: class E sortase [Jiangellaceae bacterium]